MRESTVQLVGPGDVTIYLEYNLIYNQQHTYQLMDLCFQRQIYRIKSEIEEVAEHLNIDHIMFNGPKIEVEKLNSTN